MLNTGGIQARSFYRRIGTLPPIAGLVNCLVNPMRGLMVVLQARINQLEGE